MQYRTFGKTGESVSILGYGCMRLPQRLGLVDEARTERQMLSAIEAGVNYFDTAYIYHGGRSESVLGHFLAKGYRDKVFIADKIPPYMAYSRQDMDKILNTQLERLQTDHIDFYLVHSLMSWESWADFRALGFDDFVRDNLASGKIRHIGFSWHGNKEDFKRVVDDFDWEFVQIQYNYLDEAYQAGREGLAHAHAKGLGVSIMEPLRGGLLSGRMPSEAENIMKRAPIRRSAADWAFNWIWDQPEVSLLLSGMNEETHIAENLVLAEKAKPGQFKDGDHAVIRLVRDAFKQRMKVDCTGCGYCMPCPFGVDIPGVFCGLERIQPVWLQAPETLPHADDQRCHGRQSLPCRHVPELWKMRNKMPAAHSHSIQAQAGPSGNVSPRAQSRGGRRQGLYKAEDTLGQQRRTRQEMTRGRRPPGNQRGFNSQKGARLR